MAGVTRAVMQKIVEKVGGLHAGGKQVRAYLGDPPANPPLPYAFTWGPPAIPRAHDIAGRGRDVNQVIRVQAVAGTAPNALDLADTIITALAGWAPTVPGWRVFPLTVTDATNVQSDNSTVVAETNRNPRWVSIGLRIQATQRQE